MKLLLSLVLVSLAFPAFARDLIANGSTLEFTRDIPLVNKSNREQMTSYPSQLPEGVRCMVMSEIAGHQTRTIPKGTRVRVGWSEDNRTLISVNGKMLLVLCDNSITGDPIHSSALSKSFLESHLPVHVLQVAPAVPAVAVQRSNGAT